MKIKFLIFTILNALLFAGIIHAQRSTITPNYVTSIPTTCNSNDKGETLFIVKNVGVFVCKNNTIVEINSVTDATATTEGATKLSVAPVSPASPIAVGDNDARVTSETYLGKYASLPAAITAIGSTTKTTLVVSVPATVTANATIPENVTLRITNTGAFNISSGAILTVEGNADMPRKQIFSGAGTVKFKTVPDFVYPEWFGVVSTISAPSAAVQTANVVALNQAIQSLQTRVFNYMDEPCGKILFGGGKNYFFNGLIDIDQTSGCILTSSGNARAALIYTASGSGNFITLNSTQNFLAEDITFRYTNAAYTGHLVKAGRSASGYDPVFLNFNRVFFEGVGADQAASLLFLQYALTSNVKNGRFSSANVGIFGRDSGGNNSSNAIQVDNNWFIYTQVAIKNAFEAWEIVNNTLEAYGGANASNKLYDFDGSLYSFNITFRNNWVGDPIRIYNTPVIRVGGFGIVLDNNRLTAYTGETFASVEITAGSRGVNIFGNTFGTLKGVQFTGVSYDVSIPSNVFSQNVGSEPIVNPQNAGGLAFFGHNDFEQRFQQQTIFTNLLKAPQLQIPFGESTSILTNVITESNGNLKITPSGGLARVYNSNGNANFWIDSYDNTYTSTLSFGTAFTSRGTISANLSGINLTNGIGTTTRPFRVKLKNSAGVEATQLEIQPNGNTSVLGSLQIGGGTAVTQILSATASLDFSGLAPNTCEELDITGFTGLADGDVVSLGLPLALTNDEGVITDTIFNGFVKSATIVTVRRCYVGHTEGFNAPVVTVRASVTRF